MSETFRSSRARALAFVLAGVALCSVQSASAAAQVGVDASSYVQVSSVRYDRTRFDFTYTAQAVNSGNAIGNSCTGAVISSSPNTLVLDGTLSFPAVPAKSRVTSSDTFKIRHDRTFPFDPASLSWQVQCATPVNNAPTANAGADQTVFTGTTVTLNGSASSDPDGDSLIFSWAFTQRPAGSNAALSSATAVMPTFLADVDGEYHVRLIVSDGQVESAADIVVVTTIPQNVPPVANAGPDQSAFVGDVVTLDGTASTDANGDTLSFSWAFTQRPAGSVAALTGANTAQPTFTPDAAGDYTIRLTVNDGNGGTSEATVTVSTQNRNQPPVANAGPDQSVAVGQSVQLDGSGSFDPEGTPLTFAWSFVARPAGSSASLTNAASATASFVADRSGNFVVQLIVSDGSLFSAADTVLVSTNNTPPVADAGPDQTVDAGSLVQLDGTGSSDANNDPLSFAWSLTTRPQGSTAVIADALTPLPTFTADRPGLYTAQLIVNDGSVDSAPDTVNITARNRAPNAADDTATTQSGTPVAIDVLANDTDDDDDTLTVNAVTQAVNGTVVNNNSDVQYTPNAGFSGTDTFTYTVSDGRGGTDSATVTVTVSAQNTITLSPSIVNMLTTQSRTVTVTLSGAAGAGGQVVDLVSSNTAVATVPASVTVAAGQATASFQVTSAAIAGSVTVTASATGFTSGTATVNVSDREMSLALSSNLVGVGRTITATVTLANTAPAGGVTVNLVSGTPAVATVSPASLTIPGGGTFATFVVTGAAIGSTDLAASATGFSSATATVTVTNNLVSIGAISVTAPGQSLAFPVSLTQPAPAGGVTINFVSSNPAVGTVSASVTVPAGQQTPSANPVFTGVNIGTTLISATANGFAPDSRSATVTVTLSLTPATLNVAEGATQNATVTLSAPAPAGGLTLDVSSSDTAVFTVPATVTVPAGQLSAQIPVTGLALGSNRTLTVGALGIAPVTSIVNVVPAPAINVADATVGEDLQESLQGSLAQPAPPVVGVVVTITSADPSRLLLSTNPQVLGSASIQLNIAGGSASIPAFFLQALAGTGSVQITTSAPGYATDTSTITLAPSGFVEINQTSITTTSFSANTTLTVRPARLNSGTLTYAASQALRPAGLGLVLPVQVVVTSSDTSTGVITTSPIAFLANVATVTTAFDPLNEGTSTISIVPPPGFDAPANFREIPATVNAPGFSGTAVAQRIGANLQDSFTPGLSQVPPSPVDLTITSTNTAVAVVSTSPTVLGGASVVFPNLAATGGQTVFIQATGAPGSTTSLTVSAPGFSTATVPVTIDPSGFVEINLNSTVSTTTFSTNTGLLIRSARLNPGTLTYGTSQSLRPAGLGLVLPIAVPVTSLDANVGVITTSPVTFNANVPSVSTSFDPLNQGSTTISIGTPAGFSTPSNFRQITVNVSAPTLGGTGSARVGEDLQDSVTVSLSTAPPAPVDITITSDNTAVAVVSTSATVLGGATISFNGVSGTAANTYFVQATGTAGQTANLTITAPGYSTRTVPVTIDPSGFVEINQNATVSTTTFSQNTSLLIRSARLTEGTLAYAAQQSVRPAGAGLTLPIAVSVTSSDTAAGVITASPVLFGAGVQEVNTAFDPLTAGTTTISIVPPARFDTPSNWRQIVVTVSAPNITVPASLPLGQNLEHSVTVSLAVPPPNPVDITATIASTAVAVLSTSPAALGGNSVTFPNVTSGSQTLWVQAIGGVGQSTTITLTAPGYNSATITVSIDPSGFVNINQNATISTTVGAANTALTVRPARLDPASLNYAASAVLRPAGLGFTPPVQVTVTSSNPSVGVITISPLSFDTNVATLNTAFDPTAQGTTTVTYQTPPGFSTPNNFRTNVITVNP